MNYKTISVYDKVGCFFLMVIWSESRMEQYGEDNHQEDAQPFRKFLFIASTNCDGPQIPTQSETKFSSFFIGQKTVFICIISSFAFINEITHWKKSLTIWKIGNYPTVNFFDFVKEDFSIVITKVYICYTV